MSSGGSLILASASPRRREILATLGLSFEVRPSRADETGLQIEDDITFVREAALLKLRSALGEASEAGTYFLAADTIVCVDGRRLGKPSDEQDALRMLKLLVGRDHLVRTAVALGRSGDGLIDTRLAETRVWFRAASDDALRRYLASGESYDKAGAYAVQGLGSGFVTRLDGSYTNVVGLPASEVLTLLLEHGALQRWP